MSDSEVPPTNPEGSAPPESYEEETEGEKFARLVGVMIAPIKSDTAAMKTIAQQVFDRVEKFIHESKQRFDAVERRLTVLEGRVTALEPGDE